MAKGYTPPAQTLYMVIDVTTVEETKLLAVADLRRAVLLGYLYKDDGRKVIAPPIEGRGFSKLEKLQLQYFYWNVCQDTPPEDYAELISKCITKLKEVVTEPRSYESLMSEINRRGINLEDPTEKREAKEPTPRDPNALPVRPSPISVTGVVWELADAEFAKAGNQMPDRKKVIDACIAEEINPATASTQYAKWAKAKRAELGI